MVRFYTAFSIMLMMNMIVHEKDIMNMQLTYFTANKIIHNGIGLLVKEPCVEVCSQILFFPQGIDAAFSFISISLCRGQVSWRCQPLIELRYPNSTDCLATFHLSLYDQIFIYGSTAVRLRQGKWPKAKIFASSNSVLPLMTFVRHDYHFHDRNIWKDNDKQKSCFPYCNYFNLRGGIN